MAGSAGTRPERRSVEQRAVNTSEAAREDHITRFNVTRTLTALLAGTAVTLLSDIVTDPNAVYRDVDTNYTVIVEGWRMKVKGTTAWSGGAGTYVQIEDTAGQSFIRVVSAGLTSNNLLMDNSANVTLDPLYTNTGQRLTAGKGIRVKADNNYGAGSDLQITIWGYIERLS